ncbi:unnamed protein product [Boreogadus saida]
MSQLEDPSEVKTSASAEWSCLHRGTAGSSKKLSPADPSLLSPDTAGSSKKLSPADPSLPGATAAVGKASPGGTR